MTVSQQPKTKTPSDADLKGNPGIGTSAGTSRDDQATDGETTFEGDVMSDSMPQGGVDPNQRGRTNK